MIINLSRNQHSRKTFQTTYSYKKAEQSEKAMEGQEIVDDEPEKDSLESLISYEYQNSSENL